MSLLSIVQVVAVEPSLESVRRLQKAAQLSGTTKYITLVNNGISNERTVVKLDVSIKGKYYISLFLFTSWLTGYEVVRLRVVGKNCFREILLKCCLK